MLGVLRGENGHFPTLSNKRPGAHQVRPLRENGIGIVGDYSLQGRDLRAEYSSFNAILRVQGN
jgi:hypothetical protein